MSTATMTASPLDLLEQMAAGAAPAKGKKKEALNVDVSADLIARWEQAKAEADTANSLLETVEAQLVAEATPKRRAACRASGRLEASVTVNKKLLFTQTSRYCKLPATRLNDLKEAFGVDDYLRYFPSDLKIELTPAATGDQAFLTQFMTIMIGAIGAEAFKTRFKVTREASVSAAFHADLTLKPDVEKTARPFLDDQTIKPYAPGLKVA